MSLSCLSCQILRTGSDREYGPEKPPRSFFNIKFERNWSGRVSPPESDTSTKIKKQHRRTVSEGAVLLPGSIEPRLLRSSGMRRDWNFEDVDVSDLSEALSEKKEKKVRFC